MCFVIAFQGHHSAKILHQIEISSAWGKNDTSAHKMMDGRKSVHKMGRKLAALSQWIICHLELLYNICHDPLPTQGYPTVLD